MAELIKIRPVYPSADVIDSRVCHTVFGCNFLSRTGVTTDFQYLGFSQFMLATFLTTLTRPVTFFIRAISALCVVAKILQPIIQRVIVVVADVKFMPFPKKRHGNDFCHWNLCNHVVFRQRDFAVDSGSLRFQDATISPTSDQRPDAAKVTCHVKAIVSRHHLPNLIIHNTMI
jgi:hypothetical protein